MEEFEEELCLSSSKKRKLSAIETSSDDDEHEIMTNRTQQNQVTPPRSSDRIRDRKCRSFRMPSREEVLNKIEPTVSPDKYDRLKPRKLINNYTKESHRYNYDPVYTSGEESMDEFVVYSGTESGTDSSSESSNTCKQSTRTKRVSSKQGSHRIKNRHTRVITASDSDSDTDSRPGRTSTQKIKQKQSTTERKRKTVISGSDDSGVDKECTSQSDAGEANVSTVDAAQENHAEGRTENGMGIKTTICIDITKDDSDSDIRVVPFKHLLEGSDKKDMVGTDFIGDQESKQTAAGDSSDVELHVVPFRKNTIGESEDSDDDNQLNIQKGSCKKSKVRIESDDDTGAGEDSDNDDEVLSPCKKQRNSIIESDEESENEMEKVVNQSNGEKTGCNKKLSVIEKCENLEVSSCSNSAKQIGKDCLEANEGVDVDNDSDGNEEEDDDDGSDDAVSDGDTSENGSDEDDSSASESSSDESVGQVLSDRTRVQMVKKKRAKEKLFEKFRQARKKKLSKQKQSENEKTDETQ